MFRHLCLPEEEGGERTVRFVRVVARHGRSPEVVDEDVRDGAVGGGGGDVGVAEDGLDVVVHKVAVEAVGGGGDAKKVHVSPTGKTPNDATLRMSHFFWYLYCSCTFVPAKTVQNK